MIDIAEKSFEWCLFLLGSPPSRYKEESWENLVNLRRRTETDRNDEKKNNGRTNEGINDDIDHNNEVII